MINVFNFFNFFKSSPIIVYKNGGYGINFKNENVMREILSETKMMHNLAENEKKYEKNCNSEEKLEKNNSFYSL